MILRKGYKIAAQGDVLSLIHISTRNFFGNIRVAYRFQEGEENLEDIIASLKSSFERELTQDRLKSRISGYMAVERNPFAKIAPLSFKNFCLRIARRVSDFGAVSYTHLDVYKRQA